MSTSTGAKPVSIGCDAQHGLPLARFLSTLDWATDTHGVNVDGSASSAGRCIACAPPSSDSMCEDVAGAVDHLDGTASFRVGREHVLAFAPLRSGEGATMTIPAALSVDDGKLRLALRMGTEESLQCLTLNAADVIEAPTLKNTEARFSMRIAFPFVTLLFERERLPAGGARREEGDMSSASYEVRFGAMRDAIADLREMPSSMDQEAAADTGESKEVEFMSLHEKRLEKKRAQWAESGAPDMKDTFTRFVAAGAAMTMPPAFPYKPRHSETAGVSLDQSNHVAFLEAFVEQEAVRDAAMEQAEAWMQLALRPRSSGEDTMLSKEQVEKRQARMKPHPDRPP